MEPSESTIKQLTSLQESDEDGEDDEGTAKIGHTPSSPNPLSEPASSDRRGSISQNRLSSIFEGWLRPTSPTSPTRNSSVVSSDNRKTVSEPKLVEHHTGDTSTKRGILDSTDEEDSEDFDAAEFEEMLVCPFLFPYALRLTTF